MEYIFTVYVFNPVLGLSLLGTKGVGVNIFSINLV